MEGENKMVYMYKKMNDNENHPYKCIQQAAIAVQQVISFWVDGEMGVCASSNERHQVSGGERRDDNWERAMKAQKESKRANT